MCGDGCDGGYPISAWRYFVHTGVVTDEVWFSWFDKQFILYETMHACMEIYFATLNSVFLWLFSHSLSVLLWRFIRFLLICHMYGLTPWSLSLQCDPYFDTQGCSHPGCEPAYSTPKCEKKCSKQNLLWKKSKHYAANAYKISSDPYSIMAEIYKNGPVEVSFTVYEVKEG